MRRLLKALLKKRGTPMKKIHLIVLSLLTVSLITHCPASSSGNPTNGTQPPTDITLAKTIHVHVNNDDPDDTTVVALAGFFTVTTPTYSILEGNDANIFSIDSSTGVITIADANKITYDDTSGANNNNVHLLKVRASDGSDTTKATEAPLRIVVRGFWRGLYHHMDNYRDRRNNNHTHNR